VAAALATGLYLLFDSAPLTIDAAHPGHQ